MKQYNLSLLCLWLWFCPSYGQGNTQELRTAIDQAMASVSQKGTEFWQLNYKQTVFTHDKYSQPSSFEIKMKCWDKKMAIQSDYVDFFSDENEAYMIYKSPRKIFYAQGRKEGQMAKAIASKKELETIMQTSLETAVLTELKSNTASARRISVSLSDDMRELQGIKRVVIEVNKQTGNMNQMTLHFVDSAKQKKIVYDYLLIDRKTPIKLFNKAKEQVFTSSGSLLKKYQGYSLQKNT